VHEVLVIALCTVLCGGENCADMALFGRSKRAFLQEFLRLEHGIPSHDTFSRVFRLLDPAAFHAWFLGFMRRFAETCQGVIAIDGKTMPRSFDRASAASPLHLVSAWAADQLRAKTASPALVLGQIAVDDKSNEIIAVPKLLELLSLAGCILTADAVSCQRKIARQVIDQGGDYVLALKSLPRRRPGVIRRDCTMTCGAFSTIPRPRSSSATQTDKGQGRIEVRTASLTTDIAWLQEDHQWPGLKAIGKIIASRQIAGRTSSDTRYYLLSTALTPENFNAAGRSHWGVENQLQWRLDVIMDEDQARNRKDHRPENLALLRKLVLNLAKREPSTASWRAKLKRAAWDNAFLAQILTQFVNLQMR
jgi:predicted transposase YbfD/YdcC